MRGERGLVSKSRDPPRVMPPNRLAQKKAVGRQPNVDWSLAAEQARTVSARIAAMVVRRPTAAPRALTRTMWLGRAGADSSTF